MSLLDKAAPGLGDGGRIAEVGRVIDEKAEIIVTSLVSVSIK